MKKAFSIFRTWEWRFLRVHTVMFWSVSYRENRFLHWVQTNGRPSVAVCLRLCRAKAQFLASSFPQSPQTNDLEVLCVRICLVKLWLRLKCLPHHYKCMVVPLCVLGAPKGYLVHENIFHIPYKKMAIRLRLYGCVLLKNISEKMSSHIRYKKMVFLRCVFTSVLPVQFWKWNFSHIHYK